MNRIGHIGKDKKSNSNGLIVGEWGENSNSIKIQFSLDSECKIIAIEESDLLYNLVEASPEYFLNRILRDITSVDVETRISASKVVEDFFEFENQAVSLNILSESINKILAQLLVEQNTDVVRNLLGSVHEFIFLPELTNEDKNKFIVKLANSNSDWFYSILEDYQTIEEVKKYFERKQK